MQNTLSLQEITETKPANDPSFFVTTPEDAAMPTKPPGKIEQAEELQRYSPTDDDIEKSRPYPSSPVVTEMQVSHSQPAQGDTGVADLGNDGGVNKTLSTVAVELPEADVASATLSQSVSIDIADTRSPDPLLVSQPDTTRPEEEAAAPLLTQQDDIVEPREVGITPLPTQQAEIVEQKDEGTIPNQAVHEVQQKEGDTQQGVSDSQPTMNGSP